jgi:thiamine biosynthesis protein ThiS
MEDGTDLESYLTSLGIDFKYVAVGYNGEVVKKEVFADVCLLDGDVLEIVRPVGGG